MQRNCKVMLPLLFKDFWIGKKVNANTTKKAKNIMLRKRELCTLLRSKVRDVLNTFDKVITLPQRVTVNQLPRSFLLNTIINTIWKYDS